MAQNLNLYTYYDKSLADINREYLELKSRRVVAVKKKSNSKSVIFAVVFSLVLIGAGAWWYYYKFMKPKASDVSSIDANKPDLRTFEEKLGYVSVQIFEFVDNATLPKSDSAALYQQIAAQDKDNYVPVASDRTNAYKEQQKVVESVKEVQKPLQVVASISEQKPAVAPKPSKPSEDGTAARKYSILFENLNQSEYDNVKKLGATFKMSAELQNSSVESNVVWKVYKIDPNGNLVISGANVQLVKDFSSKEDALAFAKANEMQAIVRAEDLSNVYYTVAFCCTDIDKAKSLAEKSNITNKTIKIIREE